MTGQKPVLDTEALTVAFGGHVAVNDVTCSFEQGSLTAIVGPNGAGKTTYFNLMSGQLRASSGHVRLFGHDISRLSASNRTRRGIGRAFQLTSLFPNLSVLENVRLSVQGRRRVGYDVFHMAASRRELAAAAYQYLGEVNLQHRADAPAAALPHGEQRKLEVAMLLALEPKVFMFDEPTAGMSVDEVPVVLELIQRIKDRGQATVLLVEHKMDIVRSLADRIVVLHNGYLVADGNPAEVMASPIVQEAYLGMGASDRV